MAPKALGWPQTPEFATARSQEVFQPLCGFALMTLERDSFWLPHFRLALGQSAGSHPTFLPFILQNAAQLPPPPGPTPLSPGVLTPGPAGVASPPPSL